MFLSILGLYNYNTAIFDGLHVPDGIDKQEVVNNILLQCAELELIYSQWETMKLAIETWSYSNQIPWKKLYDTMTVEYNPLWNIDADIIETESGGRNIDRSNKTQGAEKRTVNLNDNETVNLTDNRTVNLNDNETLDLEDKKSVKGFNETAWAEAEKNNKTGTDNIAHTGTDKTTRTGTDNIAHTGTDNKALDGTETENIKENNNITRSTRRTGNIGVTSSQQLIEAERKVAEFNMIEYITDSFKNRFCLLIY